MVPHISSQKILMVLSILRFQLFTFDRFTAKTFVIYFKSSGYDYFSQNIIELSSYLT